MGRHGFPVRRLWAGGHGATPWLSKNPIVTAAQIVTHADRAGAPNHSPLFMVDEKYLKTGVRAFVNVALEYMQGR
jgi:metal-dependent amidase/aminoacylase/carboxypeptidase family protein